MILTKTENEPPGISARRYGRSAICDFALCLQPEIVIIGELYYPAAPDICVSGTNSKGAGSTKAYSMILHIIEYINALSLFLVIVNNIALIRTAADRTELIKGQFKVGICVGFAYYSISFIVHLCRAKALR